VNAILRAATALAAWVAAASAWAAPADAAPVPCRVAGLAHEVRCASVQRPLDPAMSQGRQIEVHYVVVPALARRALPDPVFLIAGGPGQSAIDVAGEVMPLFARLNNRRDIVFVDQRGTGRSAPLLCAHDTAAQRPLAEPADVSRQLADLRACRETLAALPYVGGADGLRYFTTSIAMQDLDAVRRQLGAERVNLVGVSYGTRAALEYQRQFPAQVRRSVLDGVAPPDMSLTRSLTADSQAAFDALLAACAGEAACARRHPRLREDWQALLAGLPRAVTLLHPLDGRPERIELTRALLLSAVRAALYSPAVAAALPAAIGEAAQGRVQGLIALGGVLNARAAGTLSSGMHFAVMCAEDVPGSALGGDAVGADVGGVLTRVYDEACADWPRGAVPEGFRRIAESATPVLLLSGGLDPVMPPRHAERAAQALGGKARHVVVPQGGHGVLALGCMHEVLWRFIDAADDAQALAVDADCAAAVPRPPAFAPVMLPREDPR